MGTLHLSAKSLERAELQLFDGALCLVQPLGDFADAALLDEPLMNDALLDGREAADKAEEPDVVVDGFEVERRGIWTPISG
jgi:hypothetical protein